MLKVHHCFSQVSHQPPWQRARSKCPAAVHLPIRRRKATAVSAGCRKSPSRTRSQSSNPQLRRGFTTLHLMGVLLDVHCTQPCWKRMKRAGPNRRSTVKGGDLDSDESMLKDPSCESPTEPFKFLVFHLQKISFLRLRGASKAPDPGPETRKCLSAPSLPNCVCFGAVQCTQKSGKSVDCHLHLSITLC